jgi:hypothetical protein
MNDKLIIRGSIVSVGMVALYILNVWLALFMLFVFTAIGSIFAYRYINLQLRLFEAQVAQVENSVDFQAIPSSQGILAKWGKSLRFFTKESAERPAEMEPEFVQNQAGLTAIDVALDIDRAFINGGTRSGKTFFCKQLAYHRLKNGDIIFALDPKDRDPADIWPDGVVVVGDGDDFDGMADFWKWLDDEKRRRGADMANIREYPFILIFFDEINDTLFERPEFKDKYVRVLRKYAQYRIGIFCIGQTDDVSSIGLKGLVQLKECFEISLHFKFNKFAGRRQCFVDFKDGEKRSELMPYTPVNLISGERFGTPERDNVRPNRPQNRRSEDVITLPFDGVHERYAQYEPLFDSKIEEDVVTAYREIKREGKNPSLYAICMRAFKQRNDKLYSRVRNIMAGYGVEL